MIDSSLKPVIISPPFGTYINRKWAHSVKGTYTAYPRKGSKILRAIQTLRPVHKGWVNRIGLINNSVNSVDMTNEDHIYSFAAANDIQDWYAILDAIEGDRIVEINVGCPNVTSIHPTISIYGLFKLRCKLVIVKLPPNEQTALNIIAKATDVGITHFHCCNTLNTPQGGRSGELLKYYSLHLIKNIRHKYPDVTIIGGGGIYEPKDVEDYRELGVRHFSLATIWFKPWKVPAVREEIELGVY